MCIAFNVISNQSYKNSLNGLVCQVVALFRRWESCRRDFPCDGSPRAASESKRSWTLSPWWSAESQTSCPSCCSSEAFQSSEESGRLVWTILWLRKCGIGEHKKSTDGLSGDMSRYMHPLYHTHCHPWGPGFKSLTPSFSRGEMAGILRKDSRCRYLSQTNKWREVRRQMG